MPVHLPSLTTARHQLIPLTRRVRVPSIPLSMNVAPTDDTPRQSLTSWHLQ